MPQESRTIIMDPNFSVFRLSTRVADISTAIHHRRTMRIISNEIENAVLVDNVRPRVFSGFQKYSFFLPIADRYRRIAERAESVYVFGVPDVTPPPIPGLVYVDIKLTDQLAKEWFIVADAPDYISILATEELTSFSEPDENRAFRGVWSFDETIAGVAQEWLSNIVDARPLYPTLIERDPRNNMKYMQRTLACITDRITRLNTKHNPIADRTVRELNATFPILK